MNATNRAREIIGHIKESATGTDEERRFKIATGAMFCADLLLRDASNARRNRAAVTEKMAGIAKRLVRWAGMFGGLKTKERRDET